MTPSSPLPPVNLSLDKEVQPAVGSVPGQVIATAQYHEFAGPMPPPDYLRGYDDIVPGAAKDILNEFLANGQHNRDMEQRLLSDAKESEKRSHWMAFCLVLLGFFFNHGARLHWT